MREIHHCRYVSLFIVFSHKALFLASIVVFFFSVQLPCTMYHVFFFVFVFVVCVFVIALILLFQCNHVPASCSKFVTPLLGESSLAGIHKYPIGRDLFQTNISNGYFLQIFWKTPDNINMTSDFHRYSWLVVTTLAEVESPYQPIFIQPVSPHSPE